MARVSLFSPPNGWGWWLHGSWGVSQLSRRRYNIGNRTVERNFKRQASVSRARRRGKIPWHTPPSGALEWSLWTGRRRRSVNQTKAQCKRLLVERILK